MRTYRLDRIRLSLDPKKGDPRVADTLIQISERVAKLHGPDAPRRIEASGPDGPIQTEEQQIDYDRLSLDELLTSRSDGKEVSRHCELGREPPAGSRIREDVPWQGASIFCIVAAVGKTDSGSLKLLDEL